jgi:glycine cleavage system H protein
MFPGVYEFRWDAGHLIFLGAFYSVFLILAISLAAALRRAVRQLKAGRAEAIRWKEDFPDLPTSSRRCRHEITGEATRRTCPSGFDCRSCREHARFLQRRKDGGRTLVRAAEGESLLGFRIPSDRLYHRGHAWARAEADGTFTVGLDDMAARLLGTPDEIALPAPGSRLVLNGTGFRIRCGGREVRILSPLDGEVVEQGGAEREWYLRVRPGAEGADLSHLLGGSEIRPWILREMERLLEIAGPGTRLPALADGGTPVPDLASALPEERRDEVLREMLLNA